MLLRMPRLRCGHRPYIGVKYQVSSVKNGRDASRFEAPRNASRLAEGHSSGCLTHV